VVWCGVVWCGVGWVWWCEVVSKREGGEGSTYGVCNDFVVVGNFLAIDRFSEGPSRRVLTQSHEDIA